MTREKKKKKKKKKKTQSVSPKHGEAERAWDPSQFRMYFTFFHVLLQLCVCFNLRSELFVQQMQKNDDEKHLNVFNFLVLDEPFLPEQQLHQSHLALQRGGGAHR